jgi:LuxR family maltose regulon positive regulatory protein
MLKQTSIAKITRPRLSSVLSRKRLFILMDKKRASPITWVSGPAGSGKTTFVASYLDARKLSCLWYQLDDGDSDVATFFYYLGLATQNAAPRHKTPLPLLTMEYMRGIPAFAKRYFENLCSRLKPPFVIVFDNYHHIKPESLFHDVIRDALSVIPEGITVIIASRNPPPPTLALFQTYNKMQTIGWEDLKFDLNETRLLLRPGKNKLMNSGLFDRLYRASEGWAAGLMLLMERLRTRGIAQDELNLFKHEELFNYFATELFQKTDTETQDFLLKTSFLPGIAPSAASELTGNRKAGALLTTFSRNNFFTEQHSAVNPVYQYHPLFREFLQTRARESFSPEELHETLVRAAQVLAASGNVEDAAELFRIAQDWPSLSRMILMNALSLMRQGRNKTLGEWLKSLPGAILVKDPWLLYWMGRCIMPFSFLECRHYLEKAFTLFRERHEAAGAFLAFAGVVESITHEFGDVSKLDPWITIHDDLLEEYKTYPSAQIEEHVSSCMFIALSSQQPWHPQYSTYRDTALALLEGNADIGLRMTTGFYLFCHHYFIGELHICERVYESIQRIIGTYKEIPPLAQNLVTLLDIWFGGAKGTFSNSLENMRAGLAKSNESGVHIWDSMIMIQGLSAYMNSGDLAGANNLFELLASMQERRRMGDQFFYHHRLSWYYFLKNDIPQAVASHVSASALATRLHWWYSSGESSFAMALLLRATGEDKTARRHVIECKRTAQKYGSKYLEYKACLLEALFAYDEGREKKGNTALRNALAIGREKGFVYFSWLLPPMMSSLYIKALEADIEIQYVKGLIKKCNIIPDEPPLHIENWPWPLKIYTLGQFKIEKDGKLMTFSGKVQKKPLDLLKALIAFGGSHVGEAQLTDVLWPDAEGDAGYRAFITTLQRLRHLLDHKDAVQLQGGRVSLDPRSCWVDAWAFEDASRRADLAWKEGKSREAMQLTEKAMNLYRGSFLENNFEEDRTASLSGSLQSRFLKSVKKIGSYYEEAREWEKAAECFQRGLESDNLNEEFYRSLMVCYGNLGRKADALRLFDRCRKALEVSLGADPSSETAAVFRSLSANLRKREIK